MIWEILFIFVLVLANGLFAAAETALIAARKGRLEQRASEGNRNAQRALELAQNPDLFLPTAQIGISVVTALSAAYGGDQVVGHIKVWLAESPLPFIARHHEGFALAIFVVCFTYVSLVFGELVPKRASLHRAEGLAILLAPVVHILSIVGKPIVWFMGLSTSGVLWALRLRAESEPTVSLDDIEHLIDTGMAEGVVEPLEQKLAQSRSVRNQRATFNLSNVRQCHRAPDRMPQKGAGMNCLTAADGPRPIHQIRSSHACRQRKTTGQRFAKADQIRDHIVVFACKPRTCAPKPSVNLIEDQTDSMVIAYLSKQRQKFRRRNANSTARLNRLNKNRTDAFPPKQRFQLRPELPKICSHRSERQKFGELR